MKTTKIKNEYCPILYSNRLPIRVKNALMKEGLKTLDDLYCYNEEMILRLRNFGMKSLHDLNIYLEDIGLNKIPLDVTFLNKSRITYHKVKNNNMRKVGELYETTDYKSFKQLNENRELRRNKKLEESILKDGQLQPAIVENGSLLDGQHRLAICEKHNIPFVFVTYDKRFLKESNIIDMNVTSINWGFEDYVNYYSKKGNKDYQNLLVIFDKYKLFSPALVAEAFNSTKNNPLRLIKNGAYKMDLKKGETILSLVNKIGESGMIDKNGVPYKSSQFMRAIRECLYGGVIKNFDSNKLIRAMAHQKKPFLLYGGTKQMIVELSKVYKKQIHI